MIITQMYQRKGRFVSLSVTFNISLKNGSGRIGVFISTNMVGSFSGAYDL